MARIRPYRPGDAAALSVLYRRSVEELGARFYNPDQVAVWASLTPTPERLDALMADGRVRLVAVPDAADGVAQDVVQDIADDIAGDAIDGVADDDLGEAAPNRPLAFVDLEPDGHIHFLYCAPEAAGRGIVSSLCDEMESLARQRGIGRLTAEASEAARGFFEKRGYAVTNVRHFQVSGVEIHNYNVEKSLEIGG